jgi:group II intron reverse transcriptase/maturase
VNTGASWPTLSIEEAEARVLGIQAKLHRWAIDDPTRRFGDLFNLVCDPALLLVGWRRVRGNTGARTAGIDGQTAGYVERVRGEAAFLAELRADLKARRFAPLAVRERMIPKPGSSKLRRLGIPTVRDRVVQAALKLVLEPIFEADFKPCSYGFRPGRRAHDALAEIHHFATAGYQWVVEGDIEACFDNIDHTALLGRVRRRVGDKRVVALVKAFCKAGVLTEAGLMQDTITGTPQGGILSPLLANIALSVLDDHYAEAWQQTMGTAWQRQVRKRKGQARYRLIRYADDFVVMVAGTRADTQALKAETAAVLARWACACQWSRPGSPISTRASTSSVTASSGTRSGARPSDTSIPTRPRRPWRPSRRRCGPSADRTGTNRSRCCCTGSTWHCGAGASTSGTGAQPGPSATWRSSPGGGSSSGCGASTLTSPGSSSAAATCQVGGRRTAAWRCSTPPR